ncbi:MAG: hypothetical protein LBR10_00865 [Prevotellaceae bacterium]|nr:hypothetical protein [Prevotellaceae bacterium]
MKSPDDTEAFFRRQEDAAKRHQVTKSQPIPQPVHASKPAKRTKTTPVEKKRPEVPPLAMSPSVPQVDDGFSRSSSEKVSQVSPEPVRSSRNDFGKAGDRKPAEIAAAGRTGSISGGDDLTAAEEPNRKPIDIATSTTIGSVSLGNDFIDVEEPDKKPTGIATSTTIGSVSLGNDFIDVEEPDRKPVEIGTSTTIGSVSLGNDFIDVEEPDRKPIEIVTSTTMGSVSLGNDFIDVEEPDRKPTESISVDNTATTATDQVSLNLSSDVDVESDSDRFEQDFDEIKSPRKSDPPLPLDPDLSDSIDLVIPPTTTGTGSPHLSESDNFTFSDHPGKDDTNSSMPSDLKRALGLSSGIGSDPASAPKPSVAPAAKSPDEPKLDFAFTDLLFNCYLYYCIHYCLYSIVVFLRSARQNAITEQKRVKTGASRNSRKRSFLPFIFFIHDFFHPRIIFFYPRMPRIFTNFFNFYRIFTNKKSFGFFFQSTHDCRQQGSILPCRRQFC